jgi:hypothetical protein
MSVLPTGIAKQTSLASSGYNALVSDVRQYGDEHGERRMPDIYKTGDNVPTTGVYKTVHAGQHVPAHYVTALFGDTFPLCLDCSEFFGKTAIRILRINF